MSPTADDALDGGDEKSIFRCLDAARYVVAAAVTVLIVTVIVYAITVVLRPAELYLGVVGGSVSVSVSVVGGSVSVSVSVVGGDKPFRAVVNGDNLTFSLTVRAINPSGRVTIYYTGIVAKLKSNMSSDSFLTLNLPRVALGPQSSVDITVAISTFMIVPEQGYYFKLLANGSSLDDAMIVLTGTRTVEIYSSKYKPKETVVYYCSPIAIGDGEDKDGDSTAAVDVRCTDQNQPASI
ncbi:uncharacterized protein LOC119289818 [Triticum dicoccoides]|uniref:uncharacterized protein LOC119289818 n=1 Tax=Triticum dicoccoides TaxID=85692 RepID=UPI00188F82FE|nr:uncharacterized protein LOC119289818 [Triticum dicoccoides]